MNYKQRGPTAQVVCPRSMKENAREAAYKVDKRRTQSGGRCPWSMKKNAQEREYSAESAESTHPSWAVDVHGPVQLHLGVILGGDGALVDGHREVAQADLGRHAKSFSKPDICCGLRGTESLKFVLRGDCFDVLCRPIAVPCSRFSVFHRPVSSFHNHLIRTLVPGPNIAVQPFQSLWRNILGEWPSVGT